MNSCFRSISTCCNFLSCRSSNDTRKIANYDPDVDYESQVVLSPRPRRKKKSHQSITSEQSSYPSQSTVPIINDRKSLSDQERILDQPIRSNKFSVPINSSTPSTFYYHHHHTRSLINNKSKNVLFPPASTVPINVISPGNFDEGIDIKKKNRTHHRSLLTESLPDTNVNSNDNDNNELMYKNFSYVKSSTYNPKKIELSNTTNKSTTDDGKSYENYNKELRKTTPNFFPSSTIPIQNSENHRKRFQSSNLANDFSNVIVITPPPPFNSNTEIPVSSSSVPCPPSPIPLNPDPNLPSPIPIGISDTSCSGDED